MAILNFNVQPAGQSNLRPQKLTIATNNASSDITVAGFLNPIVAEGFPIFNGDFAFISYTGGSALYTAVVNAAGIVTLTEYGASSGGTVTYTAPSIANNIATWSNTTGNLQNGGAIGTAATKAASNGAYSTLASTTGSGFVENNLVAAGDTAGSLKDSGIASASVQLATNIKAAVTGNVGNGTVTSNAITVGGLTTASVVVPQLVSASTGAGSIVATTISAGSFTVTVSGTPPADMVVSYVAFIAAQ